MQQTGSVPRDLNCVPLPGDVRNALIRCGVYTTEDYLADPSVVERICANPDIIDELHTALDPRRSLPVFKSGLDVLLEDEALGAIQTGCKSIDSMLGGGLRAGDIIEFCGVPGAGKTQMGIQFALNTQLPAWCGGLCAHSVIIDTEGSVVPARVAAIAKGTISRAEELATSAEERCEVGSLSYESLLDNTQYMRVHEAWQLVAACIALENEISVKVKVLVVDSVAFLFRMNQYPRNKQACMLHSMFTALRRIAAKGVAVVLINQVTGYSSSVSDDVAPALGDYWASAPDQRVLMGVEGNCRCAKLLKSSYLPLSQALFQITQDGLTDV